MNIAGFNVITLIIILLLTASCSIKAGENKSDNRFEELVQAELASGKQTIIFPKGATFEIYPSGIDMNSHVLIIKNVNIHNNKNIQIFKPLMFTSHAEKLQFYDIERVPGKDNDLWYKGNIEPEYIAT